MLRGVYALKYLGDERMVVAPTIALNIQATRRFRRGGCRDGLPDVVPREYEYRAGPGAPEVQQYDGCYSKNFEGGEQRGSESPVEGCLCTWNVASPAASIFQSNLLR